jgi:hypothetical protein
MCAQRKPLYQQGSYPTTMSRTSPSGEIRNAATADPERVPLDEIRSDLSLEEANFLTRRKLDNLPRCGELAEGVYGELHRENPTITGWQSHRP